MEPIKPREDFFFKSYQKFKAKKTIELSLHNMPQPTTEAANLDEIMIEPKALMNIQEKSIKQPPTISYKRPWVNTRNPIVPPKVKQVYKVKEEVVEQPLVVNSIPPKEEKEPMIDKPTLAQRKIDNKMKINQSARECRHRRHVVAHRLQTQENNNHIENQNPNLPKVMHDDSQSSSQHKQ